jgi:hypothetical protein
MALTIEYEFGEGNTVPYAPIFDDIRKNYGFTDTRNKPDLAVGITEGLCSPALRRLLVDVATRGRYMSLGCDLGEHEEITEPVMRRYVAGGYVQLCGFNYKLQETSHYDEFCRAVAHKLKPLAETACWHVRFVGTWVSFEFPGEGQVMKPSIWIWFFSAGRARKVATESREKLLDVLLHVLNEASVYSKLRSLL